MDQTLDKLFESTSKTRLLKLFFMNPEGQFTIEDLVKQTQLKRPALRKELAKFMRLKIVKTRVEKKEEKAGFKEEENTPAEKSENRQKKKEIKNRIRRQKTNYCR